MKHILTIEPAIWVSDRHALEDALKKLGYRVLGGGTCTDRSSCDIAFDGPDEEPCTPTS